MSPTKHPSEAVLSDYASGALRAAFGAVVAAHLEHCAHCRREVAVLESLGGALLEDLPLTEVSDEQLAHAMAAIERPVPPAESARGTVERIGFKRPQWLGPGMSIAKAKVSGEDLLYLLRLPKGVETVPHEHQGVEFTVVLKGAYSDRGETYAIGDFCETDPSIMHQPHVTDDGECICLIASEERMLMTNVIGRIVQTLTGV